MQRSPAHRAVEEVAARAIHEDLHAPPGDRGGQPDVQQQAVGHAGQTIERRRANLCSPCAAHGQRKLPLGVIARSRRRSAGDVPVRGVLEAEHHLLLPHRRLVDKFDALLKRARLLGFTRRAQLTQCLSFVTDVGAARSQRTDQHPASELEIAAACVFSA
ncbi:hypothetical protein WME99_40540 [Sorangium sp. So ce136]|uniref:hypothetical protein n=1 Tax=Sorangium sp. So ce136 TaxID=3133284 RepID=UPI003F10B959